MDKSLRMSMTMMILGTLKPCPKAISCTSKIRIEATFATKMPKGMLILNWSQ